MLTAGSAQECVAMQSESSYKNCKHYQTRDGGDRNTMYSLKKRELTLDETLLIGWMVYEKSKLHCMKHNIFNYKLALVKIQNQ